MKGWMSKLKAVLLIGLATLLLTGCGKDNLTALVPKGYGADESLKLIILTTIVMTSVFLTVVIFFVIVLLRFRRKKGDEDYIPKQVEGNSTLETVWTVIPIILVIIMAVPTVLSTFTLADDTDHKKHMNIDIIGNQYWWHYKYRDEEDPEGKENKYKFQTSQDLYVPVGEKVYLHMISDDVIHSYWMPTISGKMDVNPENTNTMYIEAWEEGVYWGKCAELCGPGHSLMDFKVIVLSEEDYAQWENDMLAVDYENEPEPTDPVAQEGKELFENSCIGCHAVDPVGPGNDGNTKSPQGPNLTNFANRVAYAGYLDPTKENLVQWIHDPESLKPGNLMTDAVENVTEEEAEKIAEYLMQLEHSDIKPKTVDEM